MQETGEEMRHTRVDHNISSSVAEDEKIILAAETETPADAGDRTDAEE